MSDLESQSSVLPSFMRALCTGEIAEDLVFPYPKMDPDQRETLQEVIRSVDDLLAPRNEDFRAWDRDGEMPEAFIEELKQFGLFGLVIPEEHGGLGFGSAAYSRTLQAVARHDASVAVTVGAHSSIGMRGLLLFGTPAQKAKYMPALSMGERIAAFCLTEPTSGSDAASIRTHAERDGDQWILNGEKLWITNGGIASFYTVFAKTEGGGRAGVTAFIVTPEMGGVSHGPHEDKMGLRASSTTTVSFDNTRVPADHVLGEVGRGFKVAMNILNSGRTGLGGGSVGAMKHVIHHAAVHARDRKQFGQPIAEFGLIKQKLGQMLIDCYAAESTVNLVAHMNDGGKQDYAVEAAISKVFATEALWRTADEALQIAGGLGYMRELPYERVVRDCRINRIFEGTNEVLRLFIALTAMNDVASQLTELASSMKGVFNDPIKGFGVLRDYAVKQASLRTGLGPNRASFASVPEPLLELRVQYEAHTRELATAADRILRKHGKNIIGKQFASRRLADIMIDMFATAAVLSRVSTQLREQGPDTLEHELAIARVFSAQAGRRIDYNFSRIDSNDDELIKALAAHAVENEGYRWDVI